MLISIIVATHNRSVLLEKAIESLIAQTYKAIEILIVDDASIDNTPLVIEKLKKKDKRIKSYRSNENIGPGASRNIGINYAKGDFIAVMDDDDFSLPDRIQVQYEYLLNHIDIGLVFSLVEYIDEKNNVFDVYPKNLAMDRFPTAPQEVFSLIFSEHCYVPNTSIMMRRELWKKFPYRETPWIGEDWYLILQLSAKGVKIHGIRKSLVKQYRAQDRVGLLSTNPKNHYKSSIYLIHEMLKWLHQERIHDYDPIFKHAIAYRYFLGSQNNHGLKSLQLLFFGLLLDPNHQLGKKLMHKRIKQVLTKLLSFEIFVTLLYTTIILKSNILYSFRLKGF